MAGKKLKRYEILVSFLGEVLGPDYEIVLHDLRDKAKSIIAIAHGEISGRAVGDPLTGKALELLAERGYEGADFSVNYSGISKDGEPLRSSSLFIKDDDGKPVGMLCVNFDDGRFTDIATQVLRLCHPDEFVERTIATIRLADDEAPENVPNSISALTDNVIAGIVAKRGVPVDRLTQEEKIEIIDLLHGKGVFLMKGAVSYVAKVLASSEASVYRYLSKLNKSRLPTGG